MKIDWKRKLTSRKFWLSIAEFISALLIYKGAAESTAERVTCLIMAGGAVIAYAIGEGLADSSPYLIGQPTDELTEEVIESEEDE